MKGKSREKVLNSSMVIAGMVVLLLSLAFVLLPTPAEAEPVNVWVNAPEYVAEGGTFVATIAVTDVTDFKVGQFDISFNSSVVIITDVENGDLDEETIPIIRWRHVDADTVHVYVRMPIGRRGSKWLRAFSQGEFLGERGKRR